MSSFFYSKIKNICFKCMLFLAFILTLIFCFSNSLIISSCAYAEGEKVAETNISPLKNILNWLFPAKDEPAQNTSEILCYVGGMPLGFALKCEGVLVVATSDVLTTNGSESTFSTSSILPGDVLYSLNGKVIESASTIEEIINSKENIKKPAKAQVLRKGMEHTIILYPKLDAVSHKYKLGLFVRDNAAGVGTLTYIRQDNHRFGALGHPVCDIDTGAILPIKNGEIYSCDIVGVNKGEKGKPGELKGLFLHGGQGIGVLDNNTSFGVFGEINNLSLERFGEPIKIASSGEIKTGKATLRCTVSGTKPEDYEIEIIKKAGLLNQNNMVIKITDQRLLKETGGIVQGMSGSPIIQNGKLIGAVTHVFVSDPTKGFATFIENMIDS